MTDLRSEIDYLHSILELLGEIREGMKRIEERLPASAETDRVLRHRYLVEPEEELLKLLKKGPSCVDREIHRDGGDPLVTDAPESPRDG